MVAAYVHGLHTGSSRDVRFDVAVPQLLATVEFSSGRPDFNAAWRTPQAWIFNGMGLHAACETSSNVKHLTIPNYKTFDSDFRIVVTWCKTYPVASARNSLSRGIESSHSKAQSSNCALHDAVREENVKFPSQSQANRTASQQHHIQTAVLSRNVHLPEFTDFMFASRISDPSSTFSPTVIDVPVRSTCDELALDIEGELYHKPHSEKDPSRTILNWASFRRKEGQMYTSLTVDVRLLLQSLIAGKAVGAAVPELGCSSRRSTTTRLLPPSTTLAPLKLIAILDPREASRD
ncbi:hypothetical protein RvY_02189 [Ramazzottius varieornatus]|uniref:Uncharacterized protein n=1 Tax=Ramazzottius varieornatus TaxID=947166 RepID=A0A1D1UPT0_RAMVA|nr:hypothetical protein RvY_02189 [Ramazzottius varieornatus]